MLSITKFYKVAVNNNKLYDTMFYDIKTRVFYSLDQIYYMPVVCQQATDHNLTDSSMGIED